MTQKCGAAREGVSVVITHALARRVDKRALAEFEQRDSMIAILLEAALGAGRASVTRGRDGGKDPAKTLLRPVRRSSKRGAMLAHFLHACDASVSHAMEVLGVSRRYVFATWSQINTFHGVGYSFDRTTDAIAVRLPCPEARVFG